MFEGCQKLEISGPGIQWDILGVSIDYKAAIKVRALVINDEGLRDSQGAVGLDGSQGNACRVCWQIFISRQHCFCAIDCSITAQVEVATSRQ